MKLPPRGVPSPARIRPFAAVAALAMLSLPGCETIFPGFSLIKPTPQPPLPVVIDASESLSGEAPTDPWLVPLLEDREDITVNVVRVQDRVEPHLHERAEETIYILSGSGDLLIEREWRPVKAGMLIHIPRNVPHAYINKDPKGTVGLSIFTPKLLSGDRTAIPFDPEKPR